jgi:hypothetical protein
MDAAPTRSQVVMQQQHNAALEQADLCTQQHAAQQAGHETKLWGQEHARFAFFLSSCVSNKSTTG